MTGGFPFPCSPVLLHLLHIAPHSSQPDQADQTCQENECRASSNQREGQCLFISDKSNDRRRRCISEQVCQQQGNTKCGGTQARWDNILKHCIQWPDAEVEGGSCNNEHCNEYREVMDEERYESHWSANEK